MGNAMPKPSDLAAELFFKRPDAVKITNEEIVKGRMLEPAAKQPLIKKESDNKIGQAFGI